MIDGIDYGRTAGIDYGLGQTNKDHEAGIRYGVIHQNAVFMAWAEESTADYGEVVCVECGEAIPEDGECPEHGHDAEDFHDLAEVQHFVLVDNEEGYEAISDEMGDIFVTKSPYFTYAQFCSPCAPGACHLNSPISPEHHIDNRTYCFGHEWFDDGEAPYRVWSVETGEEILP